MVSRKGAKSIFLAPLRLSLRLCVKPLQLQPKYLQSDTKTHASFGLIATKEDIRWELISHSKE
jgi:hypothetical protein